MSADIQQHQAIQGNGGDQRPPMDHPAVPGVCPLSASCLRTLTDKLYEKRKAAAIEIERIVRDLVQQQQMGQVELIIHELAGLARNPSPHSRKGGLIGLAATAIALGRLTIEYTDMILLPVLPSFDDTDARTRYFACESLYNIVKIARASILPRFGELFDCMSRLCCDSDQNVRNGSVLLDTLLKDIATSSESFQVSDFIVLLTERLYSKNSNTRSFLVSWVLALYNSPRTAAALVPHIPSILDGLFLILLDPSEKIRKECEVLLGEVLKSVIQEHKRTDVTKMANIVIVHAQSQENNTLQYYSLVWMREFLNLDAQGMMQFAAGYLTAVLPCLSTQSKERRGIRDVARSLNKLLLKQLNENAVIVDSLDVSSLVITLKSHIGNSNAAVETRVAALQWVHALYRRTPRSMFAHMQNDLFPILLKLLSDSSDDVVMLVLEVLSDVCNPTGQQDQQHISHLQLRSELSRAQLQRYSAYFVQFLLSLLDVLRLDPHLLANRAQFIIRQLCVLLNADQVFYTLAVLLTYEVTDLRFAFTMVQTLNSILFTSTELHTLRTRLVALNSRDTVDFMLVLYRSWCHHPVALVSLCLLCQNYSHAALLVHAFTDLEITSELLAEIDRLVQLIESPIFSHLRLQLLDLTYQRDLAACLFGLLMLMPQTASFDQLKARLNCIPPAHVICVRKQQKGEDENNKKDNRHKYMKEVDMDSLLTHYTDVQTAHKRQRAETRKRNLRDKTAGL